MGKSCVLVVSMLWLLIHSSSSLMRCKKHELDALSKFKRSFTHDPMDRLFSWVGDDCCRWLGVTCDNVTNNVVKLNLRNRNVSDFDDTGSGSSSSLVSSKLSSALLELKFLSHFDISYNNFSSSRIPKFLGSMVNLRYLNLSGAVFSGQIPRQLGNLTNLIHLDCAAEEYGLYEHTDLAWTSGLLKLQTLDMSGVNMSQTVDPINVFIQLPSLLALSLSGCNLLDTHFGKVFVANASNTVSPLQHLDLSGNLIEGLFPSFLKNMISLQSLTLYWNSLNGSVPLWLRNLTRLEYLDLRSNKFTHVEGGLWGIMGNPCIFKHLALSDNFILQEDLLWPSVHSSRCTDYDLEYLDLGSCQLNGKLPSWLGQLTKLQHLELTNNTFQGQIPVSLLRLLALNYLDLSYNSLSGIVPDVLSNLTEIEYLDFSSNSLQGTLSGIGNLSKLIYLDTSYNNLSLDLSFNGQPPFQLQYLGARYCNINTVFPQWLRTQTQIIDLDLSYTGLLGELPKWVWNMSNIEGLVVAGNHLSGSLPQHIACNGCNLGFIDLHDNVLDGSIPHWLGHQIGLEVVDLSGNLLSGAIFEGDNGSSLFTTLNSLFVLDLSDNMFSGEIQINKRTNLEFLNLRRNDFSGHISSQLCHFPYLMMLDLAHNRLSGHIPRCLGSLLFDNNPLGYDPRSGLEIQEIIKGTSQNFNGQMTIHSLIDLSSNCLVGTIPEELTNISKLMQLNLSNNHLTGHIPREIGNLQLLESLDLSNNNLSGTIPQSLSNISSLSFLNLSNNNLYGPIPTGNQLQTFDDPSNYAGNSGLCGFFLTNKCTKPPSQTTTDPSVEKEADEDKLEKMWFYLVVMSGVATGFWGVVGTLVLKKTWRNAYFRFVEETGDRIYTPLKVGVNRFKNKLR